MPGAWAAALVDVHFNNTPLNNYPGPAVIGAVGDHWNELTASGTGVALVNSAGASTGVTLTWTSGGISVNAGTQYVNGFAATQYAHLMGSFLYDSFSGGKHITLNNLTPNAGYELYLYTEGDSWADGRRAHFDANGVLAESSATVSAAGTFILGQNYLKLDVTANGSGSLDIAYSRLPNLVNPGNGSEADINGFQLQLSAVPEPSQWAMMGLTLLGVGGYGFRRYRRSKAA